MSKQPSQPVPYHPLTGAESIALGHVSWIGAETRLHRCPAGLIPISRRLRAFPTFPSRTDNRFQIAVPQRIDSIPYKRLSVSGRGETQPFIIDIHRSKHHTGIICSPTEHISTRVDLVGQGTEGKASMSSLVDYGNGPKNSTTDRLSEGSAPYDGYITIVRLRLPRSFDSDLQLFSLTAMAERCDNEGIERPHSISLLGDCAPAVVEHIMGSLASSVVRSMLSDISPWIALEILRQMDWSRFKSLQCIVVSMDLSKSASKSASQINKHNSMNSTHASPSSSTSEHGIEPDLRTRRPRIRLIVVLDDRACTKVATAQQALSAHGIPVSSLAAAVHRTGATVDQYNLWVRRKVREGNFDFRANITGVLTGLLRDGVEAIYRSKG